MTEIKTIVIVAQTLQQVREFKHRWSTTRRAPIFDQSGNFVSSFNPDRPDRYPCPDRFVPFFRMPSVMGIGEVDVIARTGTWYKRPRIGEELSFLFQRYPDARLIIEGSPLYVFAESQAEFRHYCQMRALTTTEAIFFEPGAFTTPESLVCSVPNANYDVTAQYLDRMQNRRVRIDGYRVNSPPEFRLPVDHIIDAMRHVTQDIIAQEWPSWLDAETRCFLDDHLPQHLRRACVEMLADIKAGRTWHYFAQHKSRDHVACWLMYTHKIKLDLASRWAGAYCDLYKLCGGMP